MLKFPRLIVNHLKALATPPASSQVDYLSQQTRNTFILKRRYPIPITRRNTKPRLRHRHFIYDLIEDTNVRKRKPLDLILTQYVAGVGNAGNRIQMAPYKAYKALLLPRLAEYATPENINKYSKLAIDEKDNVPFSSASVEKTMKDLSTMEIPVIVSREIPWTLEEWHVRTSLRLAGVNVPRNAVTMPEETISGPNLDIEGKEFYVTVTINNREQVEMKCCLKHLTLMDKI